MSGPILATKLYIPPLNENAILRTRLIERLNKAVNTKLTLISAPAGFGKTSLVVSWLHHLKSQRRVAWLSLSEQESDPIRFLTYLVAAFQTIEPSFKNK